jgi:hypothetical protein
MAKTLRDRPKASADAAGKIDRAVAFINERAKSMATEMLAVGRFLLKEFFDDDPKRVADRDPAKMNSFRDLAARKDLLLGYTTLFRCVKLAIQEQRFGTVASMQQLTMTHRIALLSVDEEALVRQLARLATKHRWTVAELRAEIRKRLGGGDDEEAEASAGGGDATKPKGRGAVAMMEMSLASLAGRKLAAAFDPARLAELRPERVARLRPLWREVRDRCQAALEATRGKGDGQRRSGGANG